MNRYDVRGTDCEVFSDPSGAFVRYEDVKDDLEYLDKILDVLQDMPVDIDEIMEAYDE